MSEAGGGDKSLRLTRDVRRALLDLNEGFTDSTYYSSKNFTEQRNYKIADGELHVHSRSKTSWADSRGEIDYVADDATTHRFLRERLASLDTEGVQEAVALNKAERKAGALAEGQSPNSQGASTGFLDTPEIDAVYFGDDDEDEEIAPGAVVIGLIAIGAAVWAAPRVRAVWHAKYKPRLEAWRARGDKSKPFPSETPEDAETSGG